MTPPPTALYMLTRESQGPGEVTSLLVRAATTEAARREASKKAGAEGREPWLHIDRSSCAEVATQGPTCVLLVVR